MKTAALSLRIEPALMARIKAAAAAEHRQVSEYVQSLLDQAVPRSHDWLKSALADLDASEGYQ